MPLLRCVGESFSSYDIIGLACGTSLERSELVRGKSLALASFNSLIVIVLARQFGDSMVTTFRINSAFICLSIFLLQFLLVSCSEVPQSPHLIGRKDPYVTGRILIKFRPGASAVSMTDKAEEFDLKPALVTCGSVHVHTVRPGTELEAAETFMLDPAVEYAEPDFRIFAATDGLAAVTEDQRLHSRESMPEFRSIPVTSMDETDAPNDPLFDQQWALTKIEATGAWKVSSGDRVTIAVIDSGIDLDHPEFASRILDGYNFVGDDTAVDDDYGHGTQVAGVAAAATNNDTGIAGLAWAANILPVKVLDGRGQGVSSDLTCALYWVAEKGADIVNISIISFGPSLGMQSAVNYAANEGVLIFAAAGNLFEEGNPVTYPAAHNGVIAVAASDREDDHAWFSSAGSFIDIAAPGVSIYSPFPPSHDEYRAVYGTSLATPHGAGLAALVLSAAPSLSSAQVEEIIKQSAVDLGDAGQDDKFGHGRIDATAAMLLTMSSLPSHLFMPSVRAPEPTATPTATPSPTSDPASSPTPTPSPTSTPTPASS